MDYAINLDGHPYFFVEVKKYSTENLDQHKKQAIDYAWQAQIKWVILTNLREIRIYNAEYKGQPEEQMRVVAPIQIDQLLDRFDHLWWLSKEAAKENLIEKEAKLISKVKLKEPITILSESLLRWRSLLTKEMKAHPRLNEISGLDKEAANEWVDEAVQTLLNRFIFLRTIEDLGQWTFSLREVRNKWRDNRKKPLMQYISDFFREVDAKYNAGLFAKHKCEDLYLADEVLDRVIEEMYVDKVHDVEWDFKALVSDQDILGLAYEQYLGATLTEKTAKVKTSKEKRKKMGIYYTPKYIVNYIVENTLGEVLKKTKDEDITKLRILDPACGSGSFLKEAYRRLSKEIAKRELDKQLYLSKEAGEDQFSIYDTALKDCIHGVDLDKKAVEMARLNMLIIGAERGVHRLPNIDDSIQKGNSLIDDFSVAGKNAFKWEERFKDVFEQGGFDVIIGNPPYFNLTKNDPLKNVPYFKDLSKGTINSAAIFIKRCFDLLKEGGYFGFIIPKSFLYVESWSPIRNYLLKNSQILEIVDTSKAFKNVELEQVIIIFQKKKPDLKREVVLKKINYSRKPIENRIKYSKLLESGLFIFDKSASIIFNKINNGSILLGYISENFRGIGIQKYCKTQKESKDDIEVFGGKQIGRYSINGHYGFIKLTKIESYKNKMERFKGPRILVQNIVTCLGNHIKLFCTYDESGMIVLDTINNIKLKDDKYDIKYVLALLNSKLISYYMYHFVYFGAVMTMHFDSEYSGKIPIRQISKTDQKPFIYLVDKMLSLNKRLNEIGDKKTEERAKIEEEIKKTDTEIDELVYKLYGITEEEKKIIEESLK